MRGRARTIFNVTSTAICTAAAVWFFVISKDVVVALRECRESKEEVRRQLSEVEREVGRLELRVLALEIEKIRAGHPVPVPPTPVDRQELAN